MKKYIEKDGKHWVTLAFINDMKAKMGDIVKRLPDGGYHVYPDMTGSHELYFIQHKPIKEVAKDEKLWEVVFHPDFLQPMKEFIEVVLRKEKMPRQRLVSEVNFSIWNTDKPKMAGKAPSGQYGYTKAIEAMCIGANKRIQRKAASIIKKASRKDEKVLEFLSVHGKRASSLPAKILIGAYRASIPKIASKIACKGGICSCGGTCQAEENEIPPDEFDIMLQASYQDDPRWIRAKYPGIDKFDNPFKKGDRVLYYPRTKTIISGLEAEQAWRDFQAEAADEDMLRYAGASQEQIRKKLKELFAKFGGRIAQATLKREIPKLQKELGLSNPQEIQVMIARLTREKVLDVGGGNVMWVRGKSATLKESGKSYGMYGYPSKTASLGLQACNELRMIAGHIASDLHMRKSDMYGSITGFLTQHGKTARCASSKLLLSVYPEQNMFKTASPSLTPDEWLAFEPEP